MKRSWLERLCHEIRDSLLAEVKMSEEEKAAGERPARSTADVLRAAAARLAERGIDTARLDAEVLLTHVLGTARVMFYAHPDQPLNGEQESLYWDLVERRGQGEPLAYVIGEKEFYSLPFHVNRSVLIPRPETEGVVDAAIAALRQMVAEERSLTFFDVGTGSGAIAIAVLVHLAGCRAAASDVSPDALEVARLNAQRHGAADRLTLLEGDLFGGFSGRVEAIVCNPPYVGRHDTESLAPAVRDWEPASALYAEGDGLAFIRRLIAEAPSRLVERGWLIFEIGFGQSDAAVDLLRSTGRWTAIEVRNDLAGIPRVAIARKG